MNSFKFLILLLPFFFPYCQNIPNEDLEYCNSPNGNTGICILITDCPPLDNFLREHPKTDENINYIKQFHCGFQGKTPKACCTLEDYNDISEEESTFRYDLMDVKSGNPSKIKMSNQKNFLY
ncbi:hypothetical protein ILUMI_08259 [Ignelater luminosus]|uniref:Clip domain-containing protein n=1 Tax=Ignelater luminosus TaxID=2038154 RepID=A0A8K0GFK2_IGNLU|nr:hypothetical protein ILUMI_08259 [Ignelater luminosus]